MFAENYLDTREWFFIRFIWYIFFTYFSSFIQSFERVSNHEEIITQSFEISLSSKLSRVSKSPIKMLACGILGEIQFELTQPDDERVISQATTRNVAEIFR